MVPPILFPETGLTKVSYSQKILIKACSEICGG